MAFGIVYGWLLHRAALTGVYRITGARLLDAYLLAWLLGFLGGVTPVCLYLAFGFKEFTKTPDGERQLERLHWAARAEVIFFIGYALFILATVPQRSDNPVTAEEIQQVIVLNIAFALIAILFGAIKGLFDRFKRP